MIVKNLEKQEKNTAVFTVESDAAEFEKAVNTAYQKNKGSINIPGFRKGKAPRTIIEGMFGKEVFYQDALDELAEEAYLLGVKENELRVVGTPSIKNVEVTDERTARYEFSVTLYPEVKLGEYKGLKVVKEVVDVDDEDVANEIESVRKRNARKVSVERAAEMGDNASIDFDGYLNGERFDGGKAENYSLTLGSHILKKIKPVHKLHSRNTEQAAFVVLKSPSVPSVLVETSFITNPEEERLLGTAAFRQKIATAIAEGVISYFHWFDNQKAHSKKR